MILGIAIIRLANLFAAVMLFGIFSLVAAGLYVNMDAADVAFTEAAVGGGIATLLFLSTLALTTTEGNYREKFSLKAFTVVTIVGLVLWYGVSDIPYFGYAQAPVHTHVAERYINVSPVEIGIPNMVTSVLASYRGYDTMGEVAVIFTAGISVLMLLGRGRRSKTNNQR